MLTGKASHLPLSYPPRIDPILSLGTDAIARTHECITIVVNGDEKSKLNSDPQLVTAGCPGKYWR